MAKAYLAQEERMAEKTTWTCDAKGCKRRVTKSPWHWFCRLTVEDADGKCEWHLCGDCYYKLQKLLGWKD